MILHPANEPITFSSFCWLQRTHNYPNTKGAVLIKPYRVLYLEDWSPAIYTTLLYTEDPLGESERGRVIMIPKRLKPLDPFFVLDGDRNLTQCNLLADWCRNCETSRGIGIPRRAGPYTQLLPTYDSAFR